MSFYQFAPAAIHSQCHPFVTLDNVFTDEELELIKQYGIALPKSSAVVGESPVPVSEIRRSSVSWVGNNPETGWLYDRMAFISRTLNAQFFGFDLHGFVEDFQFGEYHSQDEGHYTWHVDMSATSAAPRKFSIVLQLTDPAEYDGGELQTLIGPTEQSVDRKKGLIAAFPSWALHRVTPVTRGVRHSLVAWTCGPSFK